MGRYPVDIVWVASGYGMRGDKGHWALDLAGKAGDRVVAPEDGVVVAVWENNSTPPWVGYGPGGVLLRSGGHHHLLAHLDPSLGLPAMGDSVSEGQEVGRMARLSGPHVHWEVRRQAVDSPATRASNTMDPAVWVRVGQFQLPGIDWLWWGLALLLISSR